MQFHLSGSLSEQYSAPSPSYVQFPALMKDIQGMLREVNYLLCIELKVLRTVRYAVLNEEYGKAEPKKLLCDGKLKDVLQELEASPSTATSVQGRQLLRWEL
jgi:hypothetical protein